MPISGANLKWYLSGGASNATAAASLGGARSTTTVVPTGLFDAITGAEAAAGDTDYRCAYVRNEDSDADGWIAPVIWIDSNTPSTDTTLAIGLDPAGKNATATTIANEDAVPAGVTFTSPSTKGTGLSLPGAPYAQNDFVAVWFRRTINVGAVSVASDPATVEHEGDTI